MVFVSSVTASHLSLQTKEASSGDGDERGAESVRWQRLIKYSVSLWVNVTTVFSTLSKTKTQHFSRKVRDFYFQHIFEGKELLSIIPQNVNITHPYFERHCFQRISSNLVLGGCDVRHAGLKISHNSIDRRFLYTSTYSNIIEDGLSQPGSVSVPLKSECSVPFQTPAPLKAVAYS